MRRLTRALSLQFLPDTSTTLEYKSWRLLFLWVFLLQGDKYSCYRPGKLSSSSYSLEQAVLRGSSPWSNLRGTVNNSIFRGVTGLTFSILLAFEHAGSVRWTTREAQRWAWSQTSVFSAAFVPSLPIATQNRFFCGINLNFTYTLLLKQDYPKRNS